MEEGDASFTGKLMPWTAPQRSHGPGRVAWEQHRANTIAPQITQKQKIAQEEMIAQLLLEALCAETIGSETTQKAIAYLLENPERIATFRRVFAEQWAEDDSYTQRYVLYALLGRAEGEKRS